MVIYAEQLMIRRQIATWFFVKLATIFGDLTTQDILAGREESEVQNVILVSVEFRPSFEPSHNPVWIVWAWIAWPPIASGTGGPSYLKP